MRHLQERPNLEQLRRQAKELHRAARAGTPSALARLRAVSKGRSLSAAQLALAREYGFTTWQRLRTEIERRLAGAHPRMQRQAKPVMRTWERMREWMATLISKRTGRDVSVWRRRMAEHRFKDEAALRRWLRDQGVFGYGQTLLVWEQFGYPNFMTAGVDDLIGRQFADRPQLRPILDAVLAALPEVSPVIAVQARKAYVSLVSERRTFAVVQATMKRRVDLGLRLENLKPGGRLESAKGVGNGSMTVKLALASPGDLDDTAIGFLKRAYQENA